MSSSPSVGAGATLLRLSLTSDVLEVDEVEEDPDEDVEKEVEFETAGAPRSEEVDFCLEVNWMFWVSIMGEHTCGDIATGCWLLCFGLGYF